MPLHTLAEYEMYKDIFGHEGLYYADSRGDIWSYGGKSNHKVNIKLKPSIDKDGYRRVALSKAGIRRYFRVNRLIAEAFVENKMNKPQVNHIDENKANDSASNLEWVTYFENWLHSEHSRRNSRVRVQKICKQTLETICEYESLMEAARQNNIHQGNITNCLKGRCKSTGGFIWRAK